MPEQPRIRWTAAQLKELRRDVRAFNAARTRALKADPGLVDFLPEKLNVQEQRAKIQTRSQLKQLTREVDRELKYKFETVVTADNTVRLRSEVERVRALAQRANRLKRTIAKERGIKPTQPGEMGSLQAAELMPFREDIQNIPATSWDKFVQSVETKSSRSYYTWEAQQYKENYIEQLWAQLGATEETLELVEYVKKIPAEVMLRAARTNARLIIDFLYDWSDAELQSVRDMIMAEWRQFRKS